VWIAQQLAWLTVRDEDEPPARRHAEALARLDSIGLRAPATAHPETLRLGAIVYERKWEAEGRTEDLETALALYLVAWERDPDEDRGRGGAGAARVLDRLAANAFRTIPERGLRPDHAERFATRARELRWKVLAHSPGRDDRRTPGTLAIAAETHFALGDYEKAGEYLAQARLAAACEGAEPAGSELQDTVDHLVTLAALHRLDLTERTTAGSPGWRARCALARLAGEGVALRGRPAGVGLSLSGGGFRAVFFHLGALARLAETGILPSVAAISTVSGGSLVGAQYYLEVRRLLHAKGDEAIEPRDYVEIVQRLIPTFVGAGQSNLRLRTLADMSVNVRMIVSAAASRGRRLGELYEHDVSAQVGDGEGGGPRHLRRLAIEPVDAPASRAPGLDNWRRRAKVPVLRMRATALDHPVRGWLFTTRWMGDPNDAQSRLRYDEASPDVRDFRLGWAVAASSCPPALFEPITIEEGGRSVRLTDGGVDGDQGLSGLLDRGCPLLVCCDASGRMVDVSDGLMARLASGALRGLCFVHLNQDLEPHPLDAIGAADPTPAASTTSYGIDRDLQRALRAIRTDVDVFTEVEAYALMLSGYLTTTHRLQRLAASDREAGPWSAFDVDAPALPSWPFLHLQEMMQLPPDAPDVRRVDLGRQLAMGAPVRFRAWRLDPLLRTVIGVVAVVVGVGFGLALRDGATVTVGPIAVGVATATFWITLAIVVFQRPVRDWLRPHGRVHGVLYRIVLASGGFVAARVHLHLLDPCLRRRGKLRRLLRLAQAE
jgi:predicted acylesterase/phospholipase RssA